MPESNFKWLAVFLVYNNYLYDEEHKGDKNYITMEEQKNSLFNSIEDTPFNEEIKILIVEVRTGRQREGIEQRIHIVEKTKTKMVSVKRNGSNADALLEVESVVQILSSLVDKYKSDRHIVITFGHGSVLGINLVPTNQVNYTSKVPYPNDQSTSPFLNEFLNVQYIKLEEEELTKMKSGKGLTKRQIEKKLIDKKINILSNKELAQALSTIFSHKKLDILVMYNCLMQTLFTQYELSDVVDFLVAPESGICYPGYNWIGTFTEIGNSPNMSNSEAANLFLEKIRSERPHPFHPKFEFDVEHTWKINAVQLDKKIFESIKTAVNELFTEMLSISTTNKDIFKCLRTAKRQLFKYNRYCLPQVGIIDFNILLAYLPQIAVHYNFPDSLLYKADALQKKLKDVVNFSFTGDSFYKDEFFFVDNDFSDLKKGFGIWFPDKENASKFLFDILSEPLVPDIVPSFIEDTAYVPFFNSFIAWNKRVDDAPII